MSKSNSIQFNQNPNKNKRMLDLGERRGLPRRNATVAKSFIDFILKFDANEEVRQILEQEGVDIFTLIEVSVREHVQKKQ